MERLRCRAVLLACNGFGGNPELVRELLPEMADATFAGHVGNDGSAIAWGRCAGRRDWRDLGGYQGHGSWAMPQGVLISWALMTEGGIQVNREGRRFHDETQGYSEAAVQVLRAARRHRLGRVRRRAAGLRAAVPRFPRGASRRRGAQREPTSTQLAAPDRLRRRRAARHAGRRARGRRGPDGRRFKRALAPPYHAVKRDRRAVPHPGRARHRRAMPGAARRTARPGPTCWPRGGAARGVSGNAVWGYLSGNGLLSAVAGGAIAARTLSQYLESTEAA